MERKNIPFQYGIHRTPSMANDGELSECINIEAHNGELTPSVMPEIAFSLQEGDKLLYVHTSGNYKNYIIQRGEKLCWFSDEEKDKVEEIGDFKPTSIHSVGNTLVALSNDNIGYILYKKGEYKYLGSKPDELDISFALKGIQVSNLGEDISIETFVSDLSYQIKDKSGVTEKAYALLNKQLEEYPSFYIPFFIRASYKLYDGSHYMLSSPVLMIPNSRGPRIFINDAIVEDKTENGETTRTIKGTLGADWVRSFPILKINNIGNLHDWNDIISGVDIFITPLIYPYKTDENIGFIGESQNSFGIYSENGHFDFIERTMQDVSNRAYLLIPQKEETQLIKDVESSAQFYKYHSYTIDEYISVSESPTFTEIPFDENTFKTITNQEKLDDSSDYQSHDNIIADSAFIYNMRVNLYGIKRELFKGFLPENMWSYTDNGNSKFTLVTTIIQPDGSTKKVKVVSNIGTLSDNSRFYYYPDNNAVRMVAYNSEGTPILDIPLKSHPYLNGSYYAWIYNNKPTATNLTEIQEENYDNITIEKNKIYTSEVNNPFFFPLSGRNSIGTGDIIAISSNTKAISPGQFGQYPMIVFSTDGVWAMQVAGDGLYESIHPISKDICVNPNVLQTNGPILFATDNGLYSVISESVEHISQIMKGAPDIMDIPEVDSTYGFLMNSAQSDESFNSFLKDAIFSHDYINNRVVIYNPEKDYSYIYCMDCGMFAKMVIQKEGVPTRIQSVVKAYPELYMQSGTDIYTFVHDKDILESIPTKGIAITRPMSFSDPLAMKVINDVRLIYRKRNNGTRCRYAMFVSNDGNIWSLRTSLRGRSFKYFRFAIYTELADTDALVAMSVMFDYRRTNKLR